MVARPVPLRLEEEVIERLDRLARAMSERAGGVEVNRSSVMRTVLDRGLDVLEKELGVQPPKKKR
jgi:hypothetical protein